MRFLQTGRGSQVTTRGSQVRIHSGIHTGRTGEVVSSENADNNVLVMLDRRDIAGNPYVSVPASHLHIRS